MTRPSEDNFIQRVLSTRGPSLALRIIFSQIFSGYLFFKQDHGETRKLSYPKDNRAIRRIYGCPKIFDALSTFAEILNGLLFRSII